MFACCNLSWRMGKQRPHEITLINKKKVPVLPRSVVNLCQVYAKKAITFNWYLPSLSKRDL